MASLRHTCFTPRDLIKCSRGTIVDFGRKEQSELRVGNGISISALGVRFGSRAGDRHQGFAGRS